VALSNAAMDKIREILDRADPSWRHYMSVCDEHLAQEAGLSADKLNDIRTLLRTLSEEYELFEGGSTCELRSHQTNRLVVRKRGAPNIASRGPGLKVARLRDGNPYAPFRFHLGDEVALRRDDDTPDPEMPGVIVGGTVEYQEGGGAYGDEYEVQRKDGTIFRARSLDLIKREPPFGSNIRDAARIVREWWRGGQQ
jgi:hypothetical protein